MDRSSLNTTDRKYLIEQQNNFIDIDYDKLIEVDFITNLRFSKPHVFNFLLDTLHYTNQETYYPAYPNKEKLLLTSPLEKYKTCIKKYTLDKEIYDYNPSMYKLIAFTIHFNGISLYEIQHSIKNKDFIYFKVKDNRKNIERTKDYIIVHHGTRKSNLYSLIRNGPMAFKNYVLNGRAKGDGFYTATDFTLPMNYADRYLLTYKLYKTGYKSGNGNVRVVKNVNTLELIGITPVNLIHQIKNVPEFEDHVKFTGTLSKISHKRLLNDIKNLQSLDIEHGIDVGVNEEDIFEWDVSLSLFDKDTDLFKDMKLLNIQKIHLKVKFDKMYPMKPPFIRIISPTFERWTGHVTYGGSICAEILTNANTENSWKPSISMNVLLITVKSLLQIDGRLDKGCKRGGYTESQAKEAFQIALRKHGWE